MALLFPPIITNLPQLSLRGRRAPSAATTSGLVVSALDQQGTARELIALSSVRRVRP